MRLTTITAKETLQVDETQLMRGNRLAIYIALWCWFRDRWAGKPENVTTRKKEQKECLLSTYGGDDLLERAAESITSKNNRTARTTRTEHPARALLGSLSMQRFWATDGNRKWTFRTPGLWSFPDFQTNGLY